MSVTANNQEDPVAGGVAAYTVFPSAGGAAAQLSESTAVIGTNDTASVSATANSTLGSYTVSASTAGAASAATFHLSNDETPSLVVTTTEDVVNPYDGLTSLREAINYAESLDGSATITFASNVTGTIALNGSELLLNDLNGALTIQGPGADVLSISGNNASSVFEISSYTTAEIDGLTITQGGNTSDGGGIDNSGDLTIDNDIITGNSASNHGGGIYNGGTLTSAYNTFSGNSAYAGGGIANYGGLVRTSNDTFSGNSAFDGGGIYNNNGTTLSSTNDTFSGNSGRAAAQSATRARPRRPTTRSPATRRPLPAEAFLKMAARMARGTR